MFPIFEGAGSYPTTGNIFTEPVAVIQSLILPWLVLAASFAAVYARFLRGNLRETMSEDYIRTARAKGLPERRVIFKHGVRSAITPIVTILGLDLGVLLGGAILTETVFNIPGIGRLSFDSIQKSDLPTVQGTVLIGAFFIISLNLSSTSSTPSSIRGCGTEWRPLLEVRDLTVSFDTEDGARPGGRRRLVHRRQRSGARHRR